jgi:Replication protein/Transposase zinc-binding domain
MSENRLDLLTPEDIWSRSLLAKIKGLTDYQVYDHLSRCGNQELYITCRECGNTETRYYQCSLKFCPRCNWRIARERAKLLKIWTAVIHQPKHIVLTRRNQTGILTRKLFRDTMRKFSQLRASRFWKPVQGGCVSMELTNEGRGWHVHLHILADVKFLEAAELARRWGRLVGQDYAIVKIKDCRRKDYLGEVTKYVVKPSQMVSWQPEEIAQFICALKGIRFFTTFGSLFKLRRQIQAQIDAGKPGKKQCECGSCSWIVETEESAIWREHRK